MGGIEHDLQISCLSLYQSPPPPGQLFDLERAVYVPSTEYSYTVDKCFRTAIATSDLTLGYYG
jgi:hypothetical protein